MSTIVFDWVSQAARDLIYRHGGKVGQTKHGYRELVLPPATTYTVVRPAPGGGTSYIVTLSEYVSLVASVRKGRMRLMSFEERKAELPAIEAEERERMRIAAQAAINAVVDDLDQELLDVVAATAEAMRDVA